MVDQHQALTSGSKGSLSVISSLRWCCMHACWGFCLGKYAHGSQYAVVRCHAAVVSSTYTLKVHCSVRSRSPHHSQNCLSSRPSRQYRACTCSDLPAKQPCRLDRTVPLVRNARSDINMEPPAGSPAPPQRPQLVTHRAVLRENSAPVEHRHCEHTYTWTCCYAYFRRVRLQHRSAWISMLCRMCKKHTMKPYQNLSYMRTPTPVQLYKKCACRICNKHMMKKPCCTLSCMRRPTPVQLYNQPERPGLLVPVKARVIATNTASRPARKHAHHTVRLCETEGALH